MKTDTEAITEVLRSYATLCSAGDFEAWLDLWEEQGCQMPPGAPTRLGVAAIREGMEPVFKTLDLELELISIDEATVDHDLGLTRCDYSLVATPKEGGESIDVMSNGKALTLYRRQPDGSWKISCDCFNSNVG